MDFLKIWHRGASDYEPENTIRSFERAISLGANAIEFDVRAAKDGEIVVIHDAHICRTTDGVGAVRDYTAKELKNFRVDYGEKIPTLEEVLEKFAGRAILNIELKEEGIGGRVIELIKKYKIVDSTILSAFSKDENDETPFSSWIDLFWWKYKERRLKIGLIAKRLEWIWAAVAAAFDKNFPVYSLHFFHQNIGKNNVAKIKELTGCKVFSWTINDPEEINRLKWCGVDGIFS